jgi:enoyl-CoA hydratase/carnithine racemase
MTEHVKIKQDGAVLEIIFARPEKKNALSNAMYRAAAEALDGAQKDQTIRVVLFAAEGDAFTAGNDLADFASAAAGKGDGLAAQGFIQALGRADKPIVAAVPGLAVGVGTTMLLHCDLVYLAETASLSTPFVNLALVPEAASSMLLPAVSATSARSLCSRSGTEFRPPRRWRLAWQTRCCLRTRC